MSRPPSVGSAGSSSAGAASGGPPPPLGSGRGGRLTVAEVYDVAADIGKEFEAVIDSHGPDHVSALMQKVISALEHLELFAAGGDAQEDALDRLRATVSHLERGEARKIEERHRLTKELEQLDEHYKQEIQDLLSTIKRLQDENHKLSSSLAAATERDSAFSEDESYLEVDLVNRLQAESERQRLQLRRAEQAASESAADAEELRCENDKLAACNRDLRRKCRAVQTQLHEMIDERAELTAKLHHSHREVQVLARELGSASRDLGDMSLAAQDRGERASSFSEDADKPRFTLPELKDILQERNSLKARVSDLEDELAVYRPRTVPHSASVASGYKVRLSGGVEANCDCSYHSRPLGSVESDEANEEDQAEGAAREEEDDDAVADEDLPVQGPLPQDPEDAPWRRREESGVRRLWVAQKMAE